MGIKVKVLVSWRLSLPLLELDPSLLRSPRERASARKFHMIIVIAIFMCTFDGSSLGLDSWSWPVHVGAW